MLFHYQINIGYTLLQMFLFESTERLLSNSFMFWSLQSGNTQRSEKFQDVLSVCLANIIAVAGQYCFYVLRSGHWDGWTAYDMCFEDVSILFVPLLEEAAHLQKTRLIGWINIKKCIKWYIFFSNWIKILTLNVEINALKIKASREQKSHGIWPTHSTRHDITQLSIAIFIRSTRKGWLSNIFDGCFFFNTHISNKVHAFSYKTISHWSWRQTTIIIYPSAVPPHL